MDDSEVGISIRSEKALRCLCPTVATFNQDYILYVKVKNIHLLSVDLLSSSINAVIMHILKNYSQINFFVIIISVHFV